MEGYVYVISNKAMPNFVKVGFTTRSPKERAIELSGTASPYPAVVEYSVFVDNAPAFEREVHRRLAAQRVSKSREWFKCSRAKAIEVIKASAGSVAKWEHDREVEEAHALAQAREARLQAEIRRRQQEAERAVAEAKETARKAILEKYAPQLAKLTTVPDFCVFWLIASALTVFVFSVLLPATKGMSTGLVVVSCLIGLVAGTLLQENARDRKKRSHQYIALEAARDAELNTCDRSPSIATGIGPAERPAAGALQPVNNNSRAFRQSDGQQMQHKEARYDGGPKSIDTGTPAKAAQHEASDNGAKVNVTCPACEKLMRLPILKKVDATCPHCRNVFRVSTGTSGFTYVPDWSGNGRRARC
ncbi:GIY-YIG nuclease family protein [Paraburkholderia hospita]|uniref:GIY-YIG nuclease family protein n=1 Tax=Paraburkholderia hospita TaxID=169430 RepID=UPI0009CE539E|nr:GIY-YIG nuclease family protein [Paraburkholderia hospita]SKC69602.1 T5orf172 domain-containing protein [Paraburkholderia hospita]